MIGRLEKIEKEREIKTRKEELSGFV